MQLQIPEYTCCTAVAGMSQLAAAAVAAHCDAESPTERALVAVGLSAGGSGGDTFARGLIAALEHCVVCLGAPAATCKVCGGLRGRCIC
jgi:hypothetical protein